MKTQSVWVDGIDLGNRLRGLDDEKVKQIAKSVSQIGLLQPIVVYLDSEADTATLISGAHRLAAIKSLGIDWTDAHVVENGDWTDLDRQQAEIDENLMRSDLTELQRADHVARRAEIVQARETMGQNGPRSEQGTFSDQGKRKSDKEVAEVTGQGERTIRRQRLRSENLIPKIKEAIASTEDAKKAKTLDALAKLTPDEQDQVADRMLEIGESAQQAVEFIKGEQPTDEMKKKLRQYEAIRRAWLRNPLGQKLFENWLNIGKGT